MIEWAASRLIRLTKKYDLESCMTFYVEHFHATTYCKSSVMTVLQYCSRSSVESMKENIENYQVGASTTSQITEENTVSFHDIPQLWQPSTIKMYSKDELVLTEFSNVYGRSVRQRTGRQETKMAKTGSLPTFCYDTTNSDTHVRLTQETNQSDKAKQMDEEVSHGNGEYTEVEDEFTYSSSLGDEDFASERIPRENLFLV